MREPRGAKDGVFEPVIPSSQSKKLSIEGQRCVPACERALSSQAVSHHAATNRWFRQPTADDMATTLAMHIDLEQPCRQAFYPNLPQTRGVVLYDWFESHRAFVSVAP